MSDLIPAIPMLTPQEYSRFQQLQKRYYLSYPPLSTQEYSEFYAYTQQIQRSIHAGIDTQKYPKPFQPSNLNVETRRKQPLRDCNKPYPLYYLLKDEKNSYQLATSVHNESKQPETINMQFTLTNFNDFRKKRYPW